MAALHGNGVPAQLYVPPAVFVLMWASVNVTRRRRAEDASDEWYGVLAVVASAVTILVWPVAALLGPVTFMALGLLLLGLRGRDVFLGLPAAILLLAPVDVRGAALFSLNPDGSRVALQVAAAIVLVGLGVWVRLRENRRGGDVAAELLEGPEPGGRRPHVVGS
ncbi:hypothetical protein [Cellulomonas fimi]|uniref:Uncharacterized protein n=1 Tax=Cellulomonas fimi TaxID=1708 RepID=A0A7Y0LY18_CELFI|nr:hypothetical protein [Cellulomonas fimi]NMR20034.1 hypothetical protein [Cellulomonas fimi]